tara:strand:- start:9889 stop:10533 length:645 start_codon:yes stop_codon:yes gene_type:complete
MIFKQDVKNAAYYALDSYSLSSKYENRISYFLRGSLSFSVYKTGKTVYVSFRGTNNVRNIVSDVRFIPWYSKRFGWTHKGFLTSFRKLKPSLSRVILKYYQPGYRIIFTGHSLGAAVSQLAVVWAAHHFPNLSVSCITFASPKVGYSSFGNRIKKLFHLRVYNPDDPVTMIPPGWFYKHFASDTLKVKDGDDDWFDTGEHSMELYKQLIAKLGQ